MSYTVKMGSFNKRINSTKRPTPTDILQWDEYTVFLKEVTSYDHPTLLLSAEFATVANKHYNYAIMFGRWYWVTDLRAVRTNQIEVDMSLDILATFQTEIKGTKAFIEYGLNSFDAGDSSTRIADKRRPVSKNPSIYSASVDPSGGMISPQTGCYIVQAVGNNAGSSGGHRGLATFALSADQLRRLIYTVNDDLSDDIDDILNLYDPAAVPPVDVDQVMMELQGFSLKQSLLNDNAMAAIQSVKWLPFDISGSSGSLQTVYLGNYSTGIPGAMLTSNSIYSHSSNISIPWPATDWRRSNSQMILYIPFFGSIPVPVDQCLNTGALSITWTAEYFSGSISVKVDAGAYNIYSGSTNVAVEMGIGSSRIGTAQMLGGGVQALGGALTMASGAIDVGAGIASASLFKNVSEAVQNIAQGGLDLVSGYAQTIQPAISSAGSMGGMAAIAQTQQATLALIYYPAITDSDFESLYGHPVFKVDTPANGFCKTRGFSISLANDASYTAYINAVMDGGCFIED